MEIKKFESLVLCKLYNCTSQLNRATRAKQDKRSYIGTQQTVKMGKGKKVIMNLWYRKRFFSLSELTG